MISYNKDEIKNNLTLDNIYELLHLWGGNPEFTNFGILSETICHNPPGEGSKKLYFYQNSNLFRCYTGCDSYFDIFELYLKVQKIQNDIEYNLNDAIKWIAQKFGLSGEVVQDDGFSLEDWRLFSNYDRIQETQYKDNHILLKEYDRSILDKFNYNVLIEPWLAEGIDQNILERAQVGYYPGGPQITIPHFDIENRFIGLRGRSLIQEDCELYGKYRPIKIGNTLYTHPLGMNLYNLNNSYKNIQKINKAIIFEGEKSTLKYQSYFGIENDISVACCGSNITNYQIQLLLENGAKEIIIAFDRQFQTIGDNEYKHLVTNLKKINNKYKNNVVISFIFDKQQITNYKDSPIDDGKEIFLELFSKRILL